MIEILFGEAENKFRKEVRRFVESELAPVSEEIERKEDFSLVREFIGKMGKKGYLGSPYPAKYGGTEKGMAFEIIVAEEVSAMNPGTDMSRAASSLFYSMPVFKFGSEEQKKKYLVPVIKGEKIGAIGITEPDVGSDTAGMKTRAKLEGKDYVINGEKRFITNGSQADFLCVFAITNLEVHPHQGMSAFLVEKGMPGFTAVKDYELLGQHGAKVSQLEFKNVKVPKENMIGKENDGFKVLMDELDRERVCIAAQALGYARTPFEAAVKYSNERAQFDKKIRSFEGVSFKIAEMATKIEAAKLLTLQAARILDKGIAATKQATMAKIYSTETAFEVASNALQILGGIGYTREYPVERMLRDSRLMMIGGGTAEVLRFLIQREVFKEFGY
ncbi:MAG: acyl-CoA dehydrogenase family protein [Candidatus Atabeyarchaeum deiterrae]